MYGSLVSKSVFFKIFYVVYIYDVIKYTHTNCIYVIDIYIHTHTHTLQSG